MFWVFVAQRDMAGDRVTISGDAGHHLARVLRVRPGEAGVVVRDGRGYAVEVAEVSADRVETRVVGDQPVTSEPPVSITLLQALLPNPDFDGVIEAATALGVSRVVAMQAARSVARPASGRINRWHSIAQSAAEQSHRGRIPEIAGPLSVEDALHSTADARLLVLDPTADRRVEAAGGPGERIAIAVGPEGGWTAVELDMMRERGATSVSLGPRILRARLAPIVALAILVQQS